MAVGTSKEDMSEEKIEENGVEEEPNFDDEEGFTDDITDEDLVGDILQQRPRASEANDCCVIVDGIPQSVGPDKLPKLKAVLSKIFSKFGQINNDFYPLDENEETIGYCFVEYAAKTSAVEATAVLNGYPLDKRHRLFVNIFTDIEKFKKPEENWEAPTLKPYKDHGDLNWWLKNTKSQDQYTVQYKEEGRTVAVYWNAPRDPDPQPIAEKNGWTETVTAWSPRGTFLATFHKQGVALWAGEKWEQFNRFAHPNVAMLDVSLAENFLVTYSHPKSKWGMSVDALRIFEVVTGELKRGFPVGEGVSVRSWPHFKWSFDDKYFASFKEGGAGISVFDSTSFTLLDKKSIKMEGGLKDFAWSPKEYLLAYWMMEQGQIPARVAVMRLPEKVEVRSKNLFNVADTHLHWQASGEHLAVKVDRYGKKKFKNNEEVEYSNTTYHLEIFRVRRKDIPVDTLELKEPIIQFGWEPAGDKFCVLQGSHLKATASFYKVHKEGIQLMKTLEPKGGMPNTILWAPAGGWVVLAQLRSSAGGNLYFVDTQSDINVMNDKREHGGVTDACWDPTGRYLTTSISQWAGKSVDLGYRIWNFQGEELCRKTLDRFCQFSWRPRPPTILPEAKIKEVRKSVKTYAHNFEEEDQKDKGKASREVVEKRQRLKTEYELLRRKLDELWLKEKSERQRLRGGVETDSLQLEGLEEETVEFPLTRAEEIQE